MFSIRSSLALTTTTLGLLAAIPACRNNDDGMARTTTGSDEPTSVTPIDMRTNAQASETAGLIRTAHQGEIDQANAALGKLKAESARAYAQEMLNEHTEAQKKLDQVLSTSRIQAQEMTSRSRQLKTSSEDTVRSLESASANADSVYIDAQIAAHEKLLKSLDEELIGTTTDAGLKQYLQDLRPRVASHLERARRIKGELGSGNMDDRGNADGMGAGTGRNTQGSGTTGTTGTTGSGTTGTTGTTGSGTTGTTGTTGSGPTTGSSTRDSTQFRGSDSTQTDLTDDSTTPGANNTGRGSTKGAGGSGSTQFRGSDSTQTDLTDDERKKGTNRPNNTSRGTQGAGGSGSTQFRGSDSTQTDMTDSK